MDFFPINREDKKRTVYFDEGDEEDSDTYTTLQKFV